MSDPFLNFDDLLQKEEEKYQKVRKYLREHPMTSMGELLSETNVDERDVNKWVREGRIEMAAKPVRVNEEQELIAQFEDVVENMRKNRAEEEEVGAGMHYYEKRKKK